MLHHTINIKMKCMTSIIKKTCAHMCLSYISTCTWNSNHDNSGKLDRHESRNYDPSRMRTWGIPMSHFSVHLREYRLSAGSQIDEPTEGTRGNHTWLHGHTMTCSCRHAWRCPASTWDSPFVCIRLRTHTVCKLVRNKNDAPVAEASNFQFRWQDHTFDCNKHPQESHNRDNHTPSALMYRYIVRRTCRGGRRTWRCGLEIPRNSEEFAVLLCQRWQCWWVRSNARWSLILPEWIRFLRQKRWLWSTPCSNFVKKQFRICIL